MSEKNLKIDIHLSHPECVREALRLEWFLLFYTVGEAVLSINFGIRARSVSLEGFGLGSIIEVAAIGVLIWRLLIHSDVEKEEDGERKARRFVGGTFFVLAAYVAYESIAQLVAHQGPQESLAGIIIAVLSLLVMPAIGMRKINLARNMESRALESEAMETMVCAYMSLILLVGLGLHRWLGWWWLDSVAALGMVVLMIREGWEAFEEHY